MAGKKILFLFYMVTSIAHGSARTHIAAMKALQNNDLSKVVALLGMVSSSQRKELEAAVINQLSKAVELPANIWQLVANIRSPEERAGLLARLYVQHAEEFRVRDLEHYLRLVIELPLELRSRARDAEEVVRQRQLQHARENKKTGGRPRIAIVSLYDDTYFPVGKWSDLNKLAYAKSHGYDLYLYHKTYDKRPTSWNKLPAIMEVLKVYDWVFWSDADALFMNDKIRLESFIDEQHDMIIGLEASEPLVLNCGNFFIKNSTQGFHILIAMWEDRYPTPSPPISAWEQEALLNLLRHESNVLSWLKIVPMRAFNSQPFLVGSIYQPGDFLFHFCGNCDKEFFMRNTFCQIYKPNL